MAQLHSLTVAKTHMEPNNALYVEFEVPEALRQTFAFHQGQYLTFAAQLNGEEVRRSYSICSEVGGPLAPVG